MDIKSKKVEALEFWLEQKEVRFSNAFIKDIFENHPVYIGFKDPAYTNPERTTATTDVIIYIMWPDHITDRRIGYQGIVSIKKETEIDEEEDIKKAIAFVMEDIQEYIKENNHVDNFGKPLIIPEYESSLRLRDKFQPIKKNRS